jgi:hypothetical protein
MRSHNRPPSSIIPLNERPDHGRVHRWLIAREEDNRRSAVDRLHPKSSGTANSALPIVIVHQHRTPIDNGFFHSLPRVPSNHTDQVTSSFLRGANGSVHKRLTVQLQELFRLAKPG